MLVAPETDLLASRVAEVRPAVFAGHRLRIHYASAGQAPRWRTVDPIGLVTVRGQGCLLTTRSGVDRTYRLSRILAAVELAEPARRPDRDDLDRAWRERGTRFPDRRRPGHRGGPTGPRPDPPRARPDRGAGPVHSGDDSSTSACGSPGGGCPSPRATR
ncbi:hypothetical protein GCM10017786_18670 [Amycolatopsis deserti]|uniref:WYL domain-containing protein n=1 Tax=Amycolatopsis deserti TaxID=185696 RepID=A0ABQ3IPH5_9PSEU|nr:hypothetical protein GCM10017786_18670 [Amycolatopsis deserti]